MRKTYIENEVIGKCIFIKELDPNGYIRQAEFKCECGNIFKGQINNVKSLNHVSCGCKKLERISKLNKTHGLSSIDGKRPSEYSAYFTMISRCHNPKDHHYKWYGLRGISVCERWKKSFENFIEDMGFKPDPKLSLERVDNELGYSKENCKWATHKEQCNNRRSNIKYKGISNNLNIQ